MGKKMDALSTGAEVVRGLPDRFQPQAAAGYSGIIQYDLSGEGGGQFTVTIDKGSCKVESGLLGQPSILFQSSAETFSDIEWGRTRPELAFLTGKIKVSNPQEMLRYVKFFSKLQR